MGAINKHPSCKCSWEVTTKASLAVSAGIAAAFEANTHLERVLLAEFREQHDPESAVRMHKKLCESLAQIEKASALIADAIRIGEEQPTPHLAEFRGISPNLIAEMWDRRLLVDCKETVRDLAAEIRADPLKPMRGFLRSLSGLSAQTKLAVDILRQAQDLAKRGRLRMALENNEIPLQATFATLYSEWLQFMKAYLVDSLVAAHVVFAATGKAALVA